MAFNAHEVARDLGDLVNLSWPLTASAGEPALSREEDERGFVLLIGEQKFVVMVGEMNDPAGHL